MTNPEAEKIPRSTETAHETAPATPEAPKTPEEIKEAELRDVENRIADLSSRTQSSDLIEKLKAGLEAYYKSEVDGIQSQLEISLSDEGLMLIHKNVVDDRVSLENGKLAELASLEARKTELAAPAAAVGAVAEAGWGGIAELDAKAAAGTSALREPSPLERTAEDVERVMGHLTPEEQAALSDEQRKVLGLNDEGGDADDDDELHAFDSSVSGGVASVPDSGPTPPMDDLTKAASDKGKGKGGKTVVDKIGSGLSTLIDHL
jgi:hypothetical protein